MGEDGIMSISTPTLIKILASISIITIILGMVDNILGNDSDLFIHGSLGFIMAFVIDIHRMIMKGMK